MKKTTKISLMSGLVTAGVLLCGVHIANAQTNIDSGYTVLIPSEVTIDKESGKGSFSVSGKMDAQTELDVTTTSQNNYKLKCGSQFVDYTLDKQSFHIDNIKSANAKSFNENFNVSLNHVDMNYSGNYIDRLTFNVESNVYSYELDLNSVLDGINNYSVHDYGTADIYINGEKVADDVSDWGSTVHYGDTYEIKDIKGTTGHHYSGATDGEDNINNFPLKGKIGIDTKHVENSKGILYSSIFLKFDTNTYTVKYDSNGGNGSMADTVHKYYKSDKMDGVIKLRKNTFTKTGYKFQGWYLTRVINKETYYLYDNWQWYKEGTQPSGTKKCLYEDERRTSNATTVDKDVITAVAQWKELNPILEKGLAFDSHIPVQTSKIEFTDKTVPDNVQTLDVSDAKNGSVVAWTEPDTTIWKVSSQVKGRKIRFNEDSNSMFRSDAQNANKTQLNIKSISFNHIIDTSNTKNVSSMFQGCKLNTIDLSDFNTSKVIDMNNMFKDNQFTSLDISMFDTKSVENISYLFTDCRLLQNVKWGESFSTAQVTNMSGVFQNCTSLATVDLSKWNTDKVTSTAFMFDNASALKNIAGVQDFNASNFRNTTFMFQNCKGLVALDLSKWKTNNLDNTAYMFNGASELKSLDVSGFDTSKVTNMSFMFNEDKGLKVLDISNFDTSNVTDMGYMFNQCNGLVSLNINKSTFLVNNAKNMSFMFNNCSSLEALNVSNFYTSNVTDISSLFGNCRKLQYLNLSNFDSTNITQDPSYPVFGECYNLQRITIGSKFDTTKFTNMNLITPDPIYTPTTDGKWYNESTGIGYTPEEIPSNVTATYVITNPSKVNSGNVINIEGSDYIVMSQTDDDKYLVMRKDSIGNRAFQSKTRNDGKDIRTYEGSEIDTYLENDWYNNLAPTIKSAIQITDINQIGYYNLFNVGKYNSLISLVSVPDPDPGPNPSPDTPDIKKEDKIYNKISRHVYLPSIADIGNVVDLNSLPSIRNFLNGTSFWTRDHSRPTPISDNVYTFNADSMRPGMLENNQTKALTGVRPAFVIDLSKVNYTITGTINSK